MRTRAFHGRTLEGWRKTLTRAAEARSRGEDAAVDPVGVSVVARSLRWGYYGWTASVHQGSLEVLHALGAAAAPAVPELVEALRDETQPVSTREGVLRVLGQIGPGAQAALPAVDALEGDPQLGPAARAARAAISDR